MVYEPVGKSINDNAATVPAATVSVVDPEYPAGAVIIV